MHLRPKRSGMNQTTQVLVFARLQHSLHIRRVKPDGQYSSQHDTSLEVLIREMKLKAGVRDEQHSILGHAHKDSVRAVSDSPSSTCDKR